MAGKPTVVGIWMVKGGLAQYDIKGRLGVIRESCYEVIEIRLNSCAGRED